MQPTVSAIPNKGMENSSVDTSSHVLSSVGRPSNSDRIASNGMSRRVRVSAAGIVSLVLLTAYVFAFIQSLRGRWFNPHWTTDDAMQQGFPLYDALYPQLLENDLISEVMRGCLPPLHYWVNYGVTLLTQNPIMTGHWVMLIQVVLGAGFLFLAVRALSGFVPATLAVLWLFHSRNSMQRMTGGLPRGWTPGIFAAFLFFAAIRSHKGCLAVILLASLLNPPGALIVGVAYGFLLVWRWISQTGQARIDARKRLVWSIAIAPFFAMVALLVVQRPPHIGQMVSFSEASQMPEFQRPLGRFPFLPLRPAFDEIKMFGYQAFIGRLFRPAQFWRASIWWIVPVALGVIAIIGFVRRRIAIPAELVFFCLASLTTYSLSRVFAFQLFVPDRHLQIPMVYFLIAAFLVGLWRVGIGLGQGKEWTGKSSLRSTWPALASYVLLGLIVYQCSGTGLQGDANFNFPTSKRGRMYEWVREHTKQDALIACHPTHCDGMQLFGVRKALVTTETSHPFYPRYNLEMRRRSELSLRAHYAETLEEVASILEPEGVTHFVFRRADFRPENIVRMSYFPPLDTTVKSLVNRSSGVFAFNSLPKQLDPLNHPYVKFIDPISIIIDVRELAVYLRGRGWSPPQGSLAASLQRHSNPHRTVLASGTSGLGEFIS